MFRCLLAGVLLFSVAPPLTAQRPPITDLTLAPDRQSLLAIGQQGVEVYGWPDLKRLRTLDESPQHRIRVAFSSAGNRLVVAGGSPGRGGQLTGYRWPEGTQHFTRAAHGDTIQAVVWQRSEGIWTGSLDQTIRRQTWNTSDSDPILEGHSRGVRALALSASQGQLYSAGDDHSIRVWDLESHTLVRRLQQHTGPVLDLTLWEPEGQLPWLASASEDRTVRFWQPSIGRLVRFVRLDSVPMRVAWLDGEQLVAACRDGQVRLIDAQQARVVATYEGVNGWAYALAVDPASHSVAVGGSDLQLKRIALRPAGEREPQD